MKTTPNLGLRKPDQEDFYNVDDFNYNADVIDQEIVKRIINAGGIPSIQAGLDAEKPAAGTAGRLYVATDTQMIYLDTGTAWQKVVAVKWDDIDGKPASFTPTAHKSTHATGGSDPITPADIGAVSKAGDTMTGKITAPSYGSVDTREEPTSPSSYLQEMKLQFKKSNSVGLPVGPYTYLFGYRAWVDDSGGPAHELAFASDANIYHRSGSGTTWGAWNKLWSAGNHGPGSGLNADMVDGVHAASFARKDTAETIAANWTIGGDNLGVTKQRSVVLKIDTRTVYLTYDANGRLTKVEEKDSATVVKTTNLTYDASGRLSQVQDIAGGTTVTSTLSYDANGRLASVSKGVS